MPEEEEEAPELGIGPLVESPEDDAAAASVPRDFAEDSVPSNASPNETQNGSAPEAFNMATVDFRRVDLNTIPEGPDRDIAANIQQQIRAAQPEGQDRAQELARREAQLNEQQAQLLEVQRSLVERQPMTPEETQESRDIVAEALADSSLNANQRKGLEFMQTAINQMEERLDSKYAAVPDEVNDLKARVEGVEHTAIDQGQADFLAQAETARKSYGDDIDNYAGFIRLNLGVDNENNLVRGASPQINPATGQPHTVQSLYELVTGRTQQLATNMRAEDSEVRKAQRTLAAGTPPQAPRAPTNPNMSESEVLAEVRELGFGRSP